MTERQLRASSERIQCRICLQLEENSPVISPCNCKGSIQYVHIACLKEYFQHKFKTASKVQKKRMKEQLHCEICKAPIYNLQVKPRNRCMNCAEFRQNIQAEDIFFLTIYIILYIGFHSVGIVLLVQESIISKIIGGIWLGATIIGFNYGLYKIISSVNPGGEVILNKYFIFTMIHR